jgi:hypothetical protein
MERLNTPLDKDISLFEYIKDKPFDQIKEELAAEPLNIKVNDKGNLYICKYSQIDSDFSYRIVRQCRGIILEKGTNKVVAHAFDKFFNVGEALADKVDFEHSSISMKVDGSIIRVFYYDGKWNIATNGTIDAHDAETTDLLTDKKYNFYDLFLDGIEEQGIIFSELTKKLSSEFTSIFEMVHPISRVVVKYDKPKVYLIGIRNNKTLKELDIFDEKNEQVQKIISLGIDRPKTYSFASQDDVLAAAQELGDDQEGFVVRDNDFRRVKIKSKLYLQLHHLKGNGVLSRKKIWDVVCSQDFEILAYFPELEKTFEVPNKLYKELYDKLFDYYKNFEQIKKKFLTKKDFALTYVKKEPKEYSSFLFSLYDGKINNNDDIQKFIKNIGENIWAEENLSKGGR